MKSRTVTDAELTTPLLPFHDARSLVRQQVKPLPAENVRVTSSRGLVLASDVRSAIDMPPTDNSAMDGYAVDTATLVNANPETPIAIDSSLRIATGYPLPAGCNAVVPWELTVRERDDVLVGRPFQVGENVRNQGAEAKSGDIVLRAGEEITPLHIGILSGLGNEQVLVHRRPRVAVASSGDEVAPPGSPLNGAQVYDSDRFVVGSAIEALGAEVVASTLLRDRPEEIESWILDVAQKADVVVTSGGASVGERDWIRHIVQSHADLVFWHVGVKPGKPIGFALLGSTLLFVLPGNPGATYACLNAFVAPAIRALKGLAFEESLHKGTLTAPVKGDSVRTLLCPARYINGQIEPLQARSSQLLNPYLGANVIAVIPPGGADAGSTVDVLDLVGNCVTRLTHLDDSGHARMVDVTRKVSSKRIAVARSRVAMLPETTRKLIPSSESDVLEVARTAGVMAAKRTSQIIPLCHSLPVEPLGIDFEFGTDYVSISATAQTFERTGVEMEALTGCSVAALTIYAACCSFDSTMSIEDVAVWEKIGGKSGHWRRGA